MKLTENKKEGELLIGLAVGFINEDGDTDIRLTGKAEKGKCNIVNMGWLLRPLHRIASTEIRFICRHFQPRQQVADAGIACQVFRGTVVFFV
jgi:hypothetical protein